MSDLDDGQMAAESGTVALLSSAEINQQIATAKKYPRSIKLFLNEAMAMATLNERVAQECIYVLPRDGKNIEGPSARLAEIIASAWGNSRAGARIIDDRGEFVTAQGVFHDLERNVAITYEVQRRITGKNGKRYGADMIGVTSNAACSIALRNAILKGVPKAFWSDIYEAARTTAIGTSLTLADRRERALKALQKFGVTPAMVFAKLGVEGEADVSIDHLAILFGISTALKEGDSTVEEVFSIGGDAKPATKTELPAMTPEAFAAKLEEAKKLIMGMKKTATQSIDMLGTKHTLTDEQKAAIRAIEVAMNPEGGAA